MNKARLLIKGNKLREEMMKKSNINETGINPEVHKDWQEIKKGNANRKKRQDETPDPKELELNEELDQKKAFFDALIPDWARGNSEAEAIWQDFVSEFLQAEIDTEAGDPAVLAEYYEHYYRIILGELAELFLPQQVNDAHHGFGGGFWQAQFYAAGNTDQLTAAQYLSPRNILEAEEAGSHQPVGYYQAIRSTHFNLCGQLAVIEAMGISLPQGLRIFYDAVDKKDQWGSTILGNPNRGTYASELIDFIFAIGSRNGEKWELSHHYLASAGRRVSSLAELIANADVVIALVNIDPSRTGAGRVGMRGDTAHWVTIQDLFQMAGENFIRIYNPFVNREELYLWEVFDQGWEMAELNSAPRFLRGKKIA